MTFNFKIRISNRKVFIIDKSGRCRQVFFHFWTRFRWPLVVVDRWSLFRGKLSTKIAWAGFRVVFVDRWSLAQDWLYFVSNLLCSKQSDFIWLVNWIFFCPYRPIVTLHKLHGWLWLVVVCFAVEINFDGKKGQTLAHKQ